MHLDEILSETAARVPQRLAVACGDRRFTYAELDAAVSRVASGLRNLGRRKPVVGEGGTHEHLPWGAKPLPLGFGHFAGKLRYIDRRRRSHLFSSRDTVSPAQGSPGRRLRTTSTNCG